MKITMKVRQEKYIISVPVTVEENEKEYWFWFAYNAALVSEMGAMAGAKWQPNVEGKPWCIPKNERNDYAVKLLLGEEKGIPHGYKIYHFDNGFNYLFEHQKDGISFILNRKRCLLAYEMGLGKTLLTIRAIEQLKGLYNFWLVAPFGAQQEWKRQLKRWKAQFEFAVITTYESLHKYMDIIEEPPDVVVFDECVKIKNNNAQRSQVAFELCRLIRVNNGYIIMLSGSPAPKNPIDWWHPVECLKPGHIREGNPHKMLKRYANLITVDHGFGPHLEIKSWKEDEVKKLGVRLAPLVLVKKRKDCFDLPDKIYDKINCREYLSEKEWIELLTAAKFIIETGGGLEKLRQLSDGFFYDQVADEQQGDAGTSDNQSEEDYQRTRRITKNLQTNPKLRAIEGLLDFYAKENGGPGRLVIYAVYHASIDRIYEMVNKSNWTCERIDGRGWSNENILEEFEKTDSGFAADSGNICIVAHPGCVHGLTLSKTLCLVYYSNSFNSDDRTQSEDRRDRPGMDVTKGTRIIDLINLPSDQYVIDVAKEKIRISNITMKGLISCLDY